MTRTHYKSQPREQAPSVVAGVRIMSPDHAGATVVDLRDLDSGESLTIGRAERCHVTIYDESVSRTHCRIERQPDGRLLVIDHDSSNGVRFAKLGPGGARQRLPVAELQLGSCVYLGDTMVVPVDARARVPIIAHRLTEFIRHAGGVYGPGSILQRMAGLGQSLLTWLVGSKRPTSR